jgi:hypothetical protein
MVNEHPFQILFETLGRVPVAHADSVNRHAYDTLSDILGVSLEKPGRCILLRAPRAGHGKTHLLSRIQHQLGASHEFIPLHAAFGSQIDAASVTDDTLHRLLRPLPASGGLCVLDLITRRLFALALQPLVGSGEVPCQDREGALTALRMRPIETFDFHHPNAVTAHWARENFEVLGQRLSVELAQRCGLPVLGVAFWVEVLFRFAATPLENPVRVKALSDAVHDGQPGDGVLMERLEALLGMLTQLTRVVLVADDLEGFSTDETAALRLAAFLGSLRQSVERLDAILSVNQDIWESAFVPRLSGGLADRLSEVVVELKPLSEDEMVALLESRVPGLGARVLSRVDRASAGTHARGLIRAAGVAWLRASAMDSQTTAAPPEPPVVEPVAEMPPAFVPSEPEPATGEAPAGFRAPAASPPLERAPDPTLAIGFLAASGGESSVSQDWPAPEFTPEPILENTPDFAAPAPEMVLDSPFQMNEPVQEAFQPSFAPAPAWPAAEGSPSQAAFLPEEAPIEPEPAPVHHAPVESQPPTFEIAPDSGFQPAPEAAFQPAEQTPPSTHDTDRVDDLLRQFRERYGRGSM